MGGFASHLWMFKSNNLQIEHCRTNCNTIFTIIWTIWSQVARSLQIHMDSVEVLQADPLAWVVICFHRTNHGTRDSNGLHQMRQETICQRASHCCVIAETRQVPRPFQSDLCPEIAQIKSDPPNGFEDINLRKQCSSQDFGIIWSWWNQTNQPYPAVRPKDMFINWCGVFPASLLHGKSSPCSSWPGPETDPFGSASVISSPKITMAWQSRCLDLFGSVWNLWTNPNVYAHQFAVWTRLESKLWNHICSLSVAVRHHCWSWIWGSRLPWPEEESKHIPHKGFFQQRIYITSISHGCCRRYGYRIGIKF